MWPRKISRHWQVRRRRRYCGSRADSSNGGMRKLVDLLAISWTNTLKIEVQSFVASLNVVTRDDIILPGRDL